MGERKPDREWPARVPQRITAGPGLEPGLPGADCGRERPCGDSAHPHSDRGLTPGSRRPVGLRPRGRWEGRGGPRSGRVTRRRALGTSPCLAPLAGTCFPPPPASSAAAPPAPAPEPWPLPERVAA